MSPATLSRARAIHLIGAAIALPSCGGEAGRTVTIGSKNFTEQLVLGEMYAQLLEKRGFTVVRKLDLGGTQIAMEALVRGDIDLYPEYTGTALINVLHAKPGGSPDAIFRAVKTYYETHYHLTWLNPAPMNDTQALATTQTVAQREHLRTLSDLATEAPRLRLGAVPEFTKRDDGLPGLQRAYGGFKFKEIRLFDIGLKYRALTSGAVDVVVAFGTDGQIEADHLVVLVDDKHVWPFYQVAPVVRDDVLHRYPEIGVVLNALSPRLTDGVMRRLNEQVDGQKREPEDVAHDFLAQQGLV
jgi:osmoprotectant transport system substrate-binding protein